MALAIGLVEVEFGAFITEDYPLLKFYNQLAFLEYRAKEEKKASRKTIGKRKTMG